ncbi:unnamed protein product [Chondrus crispus]|uniref:Uncharacterized protein n=1 Tax=Chondrus crispus TaxID=2769 RepID=R7QAZ3_CHOCR|nr:unnamed protein product [Chondrus crispus]CDF34630.1 unnamed protein product [Chondrus crispus]|eukprot:XP_005714449.1 unnamed protein product [Chondrus crispus]
MKRLVGAEGTMPSSSSLALGDVLDSRQSTESALRNGLALPSRNAASIPIPMPRRASTDVALSARHVVQGKGLAAANVQHATPCSRRSPRLKALRKVFNPTLRSGVPLNTTEQKPVTVDREPSEASPDDTASIPDDIPMGARDAPGILLRQSEAALALVSKTGRGGPKAVGKLRLDSPDGEREASRTRKKQSRSAKGRQASEAVASTVKDSGPAERAPKRRGRPTGRGKDEVSVGTKKKRRAVVASQESVFADIDGNTREKSKVPNLFSDDDEDEVLQARGASVFDEIDRRETGSRVKRVDERPKRQSLTRQRSVFDEDVGVPKKKWDYDSESENSDDDFFPCQKTAPQKGLRAADRTRKPEVKRKKTVGLSPRKATGARKVSLSQSRASPRKGAIRANTANEVELQRDRTRTPSEDEEETDGDACSPSQGGSQTMSIVVEALPVKKKKATRYPEHLWTRMTSDELSTIRKGFVKYYPTPPSNMHAQGRFEQQYMREMPKAMVEALWKNELKPWSDRWWNFFTMFGDFSREKKKQKPLGKNPTLKQAEVDRWAKEFHAKHGDARIPAKTGNVEPDSTAAGAN